LQQYLSWPARLSTEFEAPIILGSSAVQAEDDAVWSWLFWDLQIDAAAHPASRSFKSTGAIANTNVDKLANGFPGRSSRITTRRPQGLDPSICFGQRIFSVIGNHPVSGTSNSIMVKKKSIAVHLHPSSSIVPLLLTRLIHDGPCEWLAGVV
jgi:hypothetical protein